MEWWMWVLVGLVLMALEIMTPGGFYVLFFGVSAVVVGLLAGTGIAGPAWAQWLAFSVLSVVSLALFRKPLMDMLDLDGHAGRQEPGSMVGEAAVLIEDLAAGGVGKAELHGASWTVRSRQSLALPAGSRCVVESVDGLTLWIRPEEGGRIDA